MFFFFLGEQFISFLKTKAKEQIGMKDSLLAEHKISIAPLQISLQSQDFRLADESGHFHHRKELAEIFNKPPTGNIDHTQLFNEAKAESARLSEKYCDNDEAKAKFKLIHGNIVGVTGQAGIGKTTLTKILIKKMLSDEDRLYDVDYIFYLKFRDIDYEKKSSFLEFLTNCPLISQKYSNDELEQLLKVLEGSEKVGIVLDGFDEAVVKEKSKPFRSKCSIFDEAKPEVFIKNLLNGNILPKAKLLVTSRPRQLFKLHKDYKPKFIVNVLGLNEDGQKLICEDICFKESVQINKLSQFINNRPDLKGFCYVPINCILVMLCICLNFQSCDAINIDSITTILIATLGLFVKNGHLQGEEFQIKNLCELAFTGFASNKLYFEKHDLKKAKISSKSATTFLTNSITKILKLKLWEGTEKTRTYFSHLLLQEFFAALHLLLFAGENQFKESLKKLHTSKFEIVSKFMFGLCNTTTLDYLQQLIPFELIDLQQIETRKNQLKRHIFTESDIIAALRDPKKSVFLQICSWIYELRDGQMAADTANKLSKLFKVSDKLLPSEIPSLHYLLRARSIPLEIRLKSLSYETSKHFYHSLKGTLQNPHITVSFCCLLTKATWQKICNCNYNSS